MITQDYTICPSERVLLFFSSLTIIILTIFSICRSRAEIYYSECIFERDNLLSWKIVTELADYRASKNDRILFFFLSNTPFDYSFDLIGDHVPCRKNELHHFQWFEFSNALGSIFRPSSYRTRRVQKCKGEIIIDRAYRHILQLHLWWWCQHCFHIPLDIISMRSERVWKRNVQNDKLECSLLKFIARTKAKK